MKLFIKLTAVLFFALVLGLGSALLVVTSPPKKLTLDNGPWLTNLAVGSAQSGLYMKAGVALYGLFALNNSETIYFVAKKDGAGKTLRSNCDYRIEGRDLQARWWSITLYGADTFLIPNNENRFSYNGGNVLREPDGSFIIHVSSQPKQGNWLPSGDSGRLYLNLRLYNPDKPVYEHPEAIALPQIVLEGCR